MFPWCIFLHLFFKIIVCIYFWLCWVFVAVWAFYGCGERELLSSCEAQTSPCDVFSGWRAGALCAQASEVAVCGLSSYGSPALEYRLYSCGPQALLLRGMWDLPRSGIEPVPPALAGRFFTSGSLENLPAPYFQPSCIIWEIPWGREWLPTAVFLSGELQGQRSLAGPSS